MIALRTGKISGDEDYSSHVTEINMRALHLTLRIIDLMWINRLQYLPEEEEERLLVRTALRKEKRRCC